jgi:hypothetical protein
MYLTQAAPLSYIIHPSISAALILRPNIYSSFYSILWLNISRDSDGRSTDGDGSAAARGLSLSAHPASADPPSAETNTAL